MKDKHPVNAPSFANRKSGSGNWYVLGTEPEPLVLRYSKCHHWYQNNFECQEEANPAVLQMSVLV